MIDTISIPPFLSPSQNNAINLYYLYDKILLSRHTKALPPKEAYFYFPKEEDKIIFNPKTPEKTLRMVFAGQTFNPYELKKLNELNILIQKYNKKHPNKSISFPPWWEEIDSLRFLQATSYNTEKSSQLIKSQIDWRLSYFPFTITDKTKSILNSGFMYIHGRDNHYRPIFIVKADKYFELIKQYTYDDLYMAIIYFMEYIINNLLIPGQIENWLLICDVHNVSLVFMPKDLRRLIDALSSCYRCRLYRNYIVGMNAALRFFAKIVMSLLDPVTVNKFRFLDKGNMYKELLMFINERNLEKKYGGKAEDVVPGNDNIFPPIMPCDYYIKEKGCETNVDLVSEEEYKEMCVNGQPFRPVCVCRELKEKWEKEEREEKEREIQKNEEKRNKFVSTDLVSGLFKDNINEELSWFRGFSEKFNFKKGRVERKKYVPSRNKCLKVSQILGMEKFNRGTPFLNL